jgi:hypothetical protein
VFLPAIGRLMLFCRLTVLQLWDRVSLRANVFLLVLAALCIFRLWIMPLRSSLWVDEMGTAFVVEHGAQDPTLQVVPQVPASIYYVLPRLSEHAFGLSEAAFRLPSIFALIAAVFWIARIAARLIHPGAAWFAAFACLTIRDFNYQAADARPYALATCLVAASIWLLIRWLDSARWLDGIVFAAVASLVWRDQLILWPMYMVLAIYTLIRLVRCDTAVGWYRAGAIFALLGLCLLPVVPTALALNRAAGAHVIVPLPTLAHLIRALKPSLILEFLAGGWLLGWWFRKRGEPAKPSRESLSLILAWWLAAPVCLFAFSILTGHSVFVGRYYSEALPGLALTATASAALFLPSRYWKGVSLGLGLLVLLVFGRWNHFDRPHHNSDWRGAALTLNRQAGSAGMPVICPSPFIEARPPVWQPGYPVASFLYSHLLFYRIHAKVIPFPFEASPEAERYAASISQGLLSESGKFAIYGGDRNVWFWQKWFAARPELAHWRVHRLGPFGDVEAVVFEGPSAEALAARTSVGAGR